MARHPNNETDKETAIAGQMRRWADIIENQQLQKMKRYYANRNLRYLLERYPEIATKYGFHGIVRM